MKERQTESSCTRALGALARMHGVQISYFDVFHRRHEVKPEALWRVLKALRVDLPGIKDAPEALRASQRSYANTPAEPVIVAWDGRLEWVDVRLPARQSSGAVGCRLMLENGETRSWDAHLGGIRALRRWRIDGTEFASKRIALRWRLPFGYHVLEVAGSDGRSESLVISAPQTAARSSVRTWGVLAPVYSLRSSKGWGCGDLSDLADLQEWIARLGGGAVGTLPLLASFLEEPYEPSPYAPASRLFWNECFVDPTKADEFRDCEGARALLESSQVQHEMEEMRNQPLVDYRRQMRLRRRILEELARQVARQPARYEELRRFARSHHFAEDYAAFRALQDTHHAPWTHWPEPQRGGFIRLADCSEEARTYYLYAQWLAERQVGELAARARAGALGLYLDFPLGVHPEGYDVWRHRELFANGICGGAPPDAVFTKGQNWGFPPFQPEAMRRNRYDYLIACFRHQMKHASVFRFDHVMGFHRLFWIPSGMEARDGVYVRYPAEEIYAIATLESQRLGTMLVGENLGTVPPYVNTALNRHGIGRTYVVQYELKPRAPRPLRPVPPGSVASLNTHDMPPFAGYMHGRDFEDRVELGLISESGLRREQAVRRHIRRALAAFLGRNAGEAALLEKNDHRLLEVCLNWLAASRATLLLINLENLWLATEPQNLPGTGRGRPNWRRKFRFALEDLRAMPEVENQLRALSGIRAGIRKGGH